METTIHMMKSTQLQALYYGSRSARKHLHEESKKILYHIAIPTILNAAEYTFNAGCTREDGIQISVADPGLAPHVITYNAQFGMHTREKL